VTFAVDSLGEQACTVFSDKTICLDTRSLKRTEYANMDLWYDRMLHNSYELIFTEDRRLLLVAYRYSETSLAKIPFVYVANFSDPSQPESVGMVMLPTKYVWQGLDIWDLDDSPMSVSVHEDSQTMIIGVPHLDTVYILSYRSTMPQLISTHAPPTTNVNFGQSVAMIDANSYAVLTSTSADMKLTSKLVQVNE
jgi:hypothetical protein